MTADATALQVPRVEDEGEHGELGHGQGGINTALLGMLLFIGSEVMFFAGLFGAYFNARAPGSAELAARGPRAHHRAVPDRANPVPAVHRHGHATS